MYCNKLRVIKFKNVLFGIVLLVTVNVFLFFNISTEHTSSIVPQTEKIFPSKAYKPNTVTHLTTNTTFLATKKIEEALNSITSYFYDYDFSKYDHDFHLLEISSNISNTTYLWEVAAKWVTKDQVTPTYTPLLPSIYHSLETSKITSADITTKGTQLKVLLTLEGNQKALFKPKWYPRDFIIEGSVYAGKDRHNGEIAAFHLSRLLGLNRAPIVTGRVVNLKTEILSVASFNLKRTFFQEGNNTCFYGVCMYCKREDPVCAEQNMLEGSITLWLPDSWVLKKVRHPWQRSYRSAPAAWEVYKDYCLIIRSGKTYKDESRLLDLIETSVFDFLIGNGDRHHYELFDADFATVLLIDNAKSFGNPYVDHIDILAPLYQCCRIRERFVARLVALKNGALSSWLKKLLDNNILAPVINDSYYTALNRRLNIVLATILVCFQDHGEEVVLANET